MHFDGAPEDFHYATANPFIPDEKVVFVMDPSVSYNNFS
jgi:hypothetical protein